MTQPLLSVRDLRKVYKGRKKLFGRKMPDVHAVGGVSFDLAPGETLGLVGESGSGKSTTGRTLLRLEEPTSGDILYKGQSLGGLSQHQLKPYRRQMQIVFQDPYAALNPRMKVGRFVAEPLVVHDMLSGSALEDRTADLFRLVGLDPSVMTRYAHEFSGGQRQRINIARAISTNPDFVVADEPITALDVSIQAQIANLFLDLQDELGLAYLFIAHDLSMVRYICDRVAVMLRGRIVELAPAEELFADPLHPYTRALLTAIPIPDPDAPTPASRDFSDPDLFRPDQNASLKERSPGHFVLE